ncbi:MULTISPECIES: hypothetical protein [Micromonospora]|uniref:hypothetical protein n=1 Tax=Micromonospora TaxID=1873 RepID=UPI0011AEFC47|nr:hypothetical protein [Verrucosispora sp. ts21]
MDEAQARRMVAVVIGGMAEYFSDQNLIFNSEAFLIAAGLRDDVMALAPDKPSRHPGGPIDFEHVRVGDSLSYVTSGGHRRIGDVVKTSDLTITVDPVWDLEWGEKVPGATRLRRSNWSRHHVHLAEHADPIGAASQLGQRGPNVAAQGFPNPPRTGSRSPDAEAVAAQDRTSSEAERPERPLR